MNPTSFSSYEGYPKYPPYKPKQNENLIWFYDKEKEFGCWIFSNFKRPMLIPKSIEEAKKDINIPKRYISPVPLHKPNFPPVYHGSIVWYVDEHGFGEAMYFKRLENGNLKFFRISEF